AAWRAAGYGLFKGVNVPSKTFGELVEHELETPSVSAEELQGWMNNGTALMLFDRRSENEFLRMSLPGARSCPNAELGYRVPSLRRGSKARIVVNCAGRTRSIIGTETLRLAGVETDVFALQNGTQGWRLAGLDLENGVAPAAFDPLADTDRKQGAQRAYELQSSYGLRRISVSQLDRMRAEVSRTTYLFDVRSKAEFERASIPGARHAPGGQLVQATDEFIAVRNARVVLCCDNLLRSTTTAIWLAGMGHDVCILDKNTALHARVAPQDKGAPCPGYIDVSELKRKLDAGAKLLDVSPGMDYREAHIQGATWGTRARLKPAEYGEIEDLVVVGRDIAMVSGALAELEDLTGTAPGFALVSTPEEWRSARLNVVASPESPTEQDCIDYLFFVHDRHDGNLEASRRYLAWELGLVAQLDDQESSVLSPLRPS
ncbi:MAG: rhodanese-like domain-containing protein, partial [Pseudomonadota bacterium]